jgi:hypothetical protein
MTNPLPTGRRVWRRAGLALVLTFLLLPPLLLLGAAVLALQPVPLVATRSDIAGADIERVLRILRTHDPRQARSGRINAVAMTEQDLDLLLNHGTRRLAGAQARVQIVHGGARLQASTAFSALPAWPGRWLNLEANFVETASLPALDALRVGRLPLPPALAEAALPWLLPRLGLQFDPALAAEVVRGVKFMPGRVHVAYAWQGDTRERMLDGLLPAPERERLRAYAVLLQQLTQRQGPGWQVPLASLLGPMFALARQRSAAGGDAGAENRAAIVVLTFFANGRSLAGVLPEARDWPRARPLRVTLAGRDDFPRHFLVSAALAVESTSPLAQAIGVYKEVADSRGGSGFSFNDMAANLAGTRFGEAALRQPEQLQARLAAGVEETVFMPAVADLPEFMDEAQFLRRYGGVGAPAYTEQMAEIERRVAGLPLFR